MSSRAPSYKQLPQCENTHDITVATFIQACVHALVACQPQLGILKWKLHRDFHDALALPVYALTSYANCHNQLGQCTIAHAITVLALCYALKHVMVA